MVNKSWTGFKQVMNKSWFAFCLETTILGGWVGGWVVENFADIKAISAQLSWSWGWGWAWQYPWLLIICISSRAFALHQFALFLSYSFLVSIVNNEGGNYRSFWAWVFLGRSLSVPQACSRCSQVFSTLNWRFSRPCLKMLSFMYKWACKMLDTFLPSHQTLS